MLDTVLHLGRFLLDAPKLSPAAKASPALLLRRNATRWPRRQAIAFKNRSYTWQEVDGLADRYAAYFHGLGVAQRDVIALMMDNRPEFIFAVMGLNRIGAISALINTTLSGSALAHALTVSQPVLILAGSEHEETVVDALGECSDLSEQQVYIQNDDGDTSQHPRVIDRRLSAARWRDLPGGVRARGGDTFCYIYTSGTTGLPKAAIIRNQRMLGANLVFGRLMHRSGPGDVIYVPLPLYHTNALFLGWGSALATGASIALRRRFSASAFWEDVRRYSATSFVYIGELCRYLLNRPTEPREHDHNLRVAVGNGLSPDIWQAFQRRFGVPIVREFYGSTEGNAFALNLEGKPGMIGRLGMGQVVVRCDPASGAILRGPDGLAIPAKVGESGLLVGRISRITRYDGYLDRRASASKIVENVRRRGDHYFDTGDLVRLNHGRWLSFVDRMGDTYRWKGENVSTAEVSGILAGATGVELCNVFGVHVPNCEGKAGMAAMATNAEFDLNAFAEYVGHNLSTAQRPLFLRLIDGGMRVTGTLKHQKVDYQDEGFDPNRVPDRLFYLQRGCYVPLDETTFQRLSRGEVMT